MRRWKRLLLVLLILVLGGCAAGYLQLVQTRTPPQTRLAAGAFYRDMPPDAQHLYLDLPLDHAHPEEGSYRAFYILSPQFNPRGPVVFFLTDGQMELVDTSVDFAFFDAQVPGASYVLIGHRGHSPTLFPEVYPGGKLDRAAAMSLYGSWQRVEDIERVRQDMAAAGLLPGDGQIMLFGASGAGVLAQQYLHRYGEHVTRVLLATTGAPDLAQAHGWTFARPLAELAPGTAQALARQAERGAAVDPALAYMLFQLGRRGTHGLARFPDIVDAQGRRSAFAYARAWFDPGLNWALGRELMSTPAADAAKVRMYELMGADLKARVGKINPREPLLYPWSADLLDDWVRAAVPLPDLRVDRARFRGEVLVVAGRQDVVFSPAIAQALAAAYPDGQLVLVRGGHRLELDAAYQRALRSAFFRQGLHAPTTQALLRRPPS